MTSPSPAHKTSMAAQEESSAHQVEIKLAADPACLCIVRSAVRKAAQNAGLTERDVDAVILALEEAMANAIRHSYGGACRQPIIVTINSQEEGQDKRARLEIMVRDFGRQVNPKEIKGRNLDDVRPGGLGVHIIRSTMDEVEYSCPADGGMQVRMVKYINNPQP